MINNNNNNDNNNDENNNNNNNNNHNNNHNNAHVPLLTGSAAIFTRPAPPCEEHPATTDDRVYANTAPKTRPASGGEQSETTASKQDETESQYVNVAATARN